MSSLPEPTIDLAFERIDKLALWSIQGNRDTSLADFEASLLGANALVGSLLRNETLQLLRLWPHQAYLLTDQQSLPPGLQKFEPLMTDLSDGFNEFRLSGEHAATFIADYLSADFAKQPAGPACLRCRLGHYVVILYWNQRHHLRLLVERSYAESFADYLDFLMARWRPEAP